nr:hypothetical protein [Nocardia salmonicida]
MSSRANSAQPASLIADPPSSGSLADRGEQNIRPIASEKSPQAPGVIVYRNQAESRQCYRSRPLPVADTDGGLLGRFIAQPERRQAVAFPLESGMPHPGSSAFVTPGVRPCFQRTAAVDGRFFDYLLTNAVPPSQPGGRDIGATCAVDGDDAARMHGLLPCIEDVDQIESSPRHWHCGLPFVGTSCKQMQLQTLVEREPCRARMPNEAVQLLDRWIEAVAEGGVPAHGSGQPAIEH